MIWVLTSAETQEARQEETGGKARALSRLLGTGFRVPDFLTIPAGVYRRFLQETGLGARIGFELQRKPFEEMRWEEIWDAALRIRNLFRNQPLPADFEKEIKSRLQDIFGERPVVVRSSAIGEDAAGVSFAGLHESFVNVRGAKEILRCTLLVWASLWSDRALLYRQELGLDIETSAMPVVVQALIRGERSGVVFSRNPNDPSQAVIEAVYGLNQGLVDGTVEPDRWILDRPSGRILTYHEVPRESIMVSGPGGVGLTALDPALREHPPLAEGEIRTVWETGRRAEEYFGAPQDVEWTYRGPELFVLQSRPITTFSGGGGEDVRTWYVSLHRSFENLKRLRKKVEEEILPNMEAEAEHWAGQSLKAFSERDLAGEISRRRERLEYWNAVYTRDCIPLAHGMRLFGQFYNDIRHPADPYEFVGLLRRDRLAGLERNRDLEDLAEMIRQDSVLREALRRTRKAPAGSLFMAKLVRFREQFAVPDLMPALAEEGLDDPLVPFLLTLADRGPRPRGKKGNEAEALEREFLEGVDPEKREFAAGLLDLGRASYRLRDDDNVSLGRVEAQVRKAVQEGERRLAVRGQIPAGASPDEEELVRALQDPRYRPRWGKPETTPAEKPLLRIKARQLTGQPAGPGIASGPARVIRDAGELFGFQRGEVLVCDAVDPNMTFVVPLATGIVERRGGMLIHGAIIAREYGLPCVTGISGATELIRTGETVTVDGYLGIVILGETGRGRDGDPR